MQKRIVYHKIFILLLLLLFITNIKCQQKSSENLKEDTVSSTELRLQANAAIKKNIKNSLFPGLIQIKQKQYWKVPFLYAGFSALTYSAINNQKQMKNYETYYLNSYNSYLPYSYYTINTENENILENLDQRNKYKAYRNLSIAGIGMLYLINLADGIKPVFPDYHCPLKAGLYSAFIPGLGQIYNKQYWKVPLVFIGYGVFAFFINYNHVEYKKSLQAYLITMDEDEKAFALDYLEKNYDPAYNIPNQNFMDRWNLRMGEAYKIEVFQRVEYIEERYGGRTDYLKKSKDNWKRNRDLNIIGISAFYLVTIIDASVFAHLIDYDVSDDLSFNVTPKIVPFSRNYCEYGLLFTMNF